MNFHQRDTGSRPLKLLKHIITQAEHFIGPCKPINVWLLEVEDFLVCSALAHQAMCPSILMWGQKRKGKKIVNSFKNCLAIDASLKR